MAPRAATEFVGEGRPAGGGTVHVTVLGAGPAGAAAAVHLARAGLSTLLVDPGDQRRPQGESMPGPAANLLRGLGLWDRFRADPHLPVSGFLSRWDGAPVFRSAVLDPYGGAWQLDRRRFDRMLRDAAVAAGASCASGWSLAGVHRRGRRWTLRLAAGAGVREVESDAVVDATGRRSAFARRLGVRRVTDTRQVCVATVLADGEPQDATVLVEIADQGWWYATRVPGGRLVVALFTDPRTCAAEGLTGVPQWRAALARTELVRARAAGAELPASLQVRPAGSARLEVAAGDGWVAAGDAACSHDPLSSRGLHHALESGAAAARSVVGMGRGDPGPAQRYVDELAGEYAGYLRRLSAFHGVG
jgi:flavin-dependent dehydrogenase